MRYEETPVSGNNAHVLSFTVAAVILGVVIGVGVVGLVYLRQVMYGAVLLGGAAGICVFVWRVGMHDARAFRIVEKWEEQLDKEAPSVQQVIVHEAGPNFVYIGTERGAHYVRQPEPAAFAAFLREAVSDGNRIQFSKRQAAERGWTALEYEIMTRQLQDVGWLSQQMHNNAPVFHRHCIKEIYEWLRESPHPV